MNFISVGEPNFDNLTPEQLAKVDNWNIYGVDGNPDFGGSHSNPYLGTIAGTLSDAYRTARTLPNWLGWGPINSGLIDNKPRFIPLDVVPQVIDSGKTFGECLEWVQSVEKWYYEAPKGAARLVKDQEAFTLNGVSVEALDKLRVHYKNRIEFDDNRSKLTIGYENLLFHFTNSAEKNGSN